MKRPDNRGLDGQEIVSEQIRTSWCTIKDDHRTLFDLKEVNVVEKHADFDEGEDDE
jgi:hypothetical protein